MKNVLFLSLAFFAIQPAFGAAAVQSPPKTIAELMSKASAEQLAGLSDAQKQALDMLQKNFSAEQQERFIKYALQTIDGQKASTLPDFIQDEHKRLGVVLNN